MLVIHPLPPASDPQPQPYQGLDRDSGAVGDSTPNLDTCPTHHHSDP